MRWRAGFPSVSTVLHFVIFDQSIPASSSSVVLTSMRRASRSTCSGLRSRCSMMAAASSMVDWLARMTRRSPVAFAVTSLLSTSSIDAHLLGVRVLEIEHPGDQAGRGGEAVCTRHQDGIAHAFVAQPRGADHQVERLVEGRVAQVDRDLAPVDFRAGHDVETAAVREDLITLSYAASVTWTLTDGDGSKTVYGRVTDSLGNPSTIVSDTIRLDTKAEISSFDFDGSDTCAPGDAIVFRMNTGEALGTAEVEIPRAGDRRTLRDDGVAPDQTGRRRHLYASVHRADVPAVHRGGDRGPLPG